MSEDILARLRDFWREVTTDDEGESPQMAMTREAADEIARLREENARLREALADTCPACGWTRRAALPKETT